MLILKSLVLVPNLGQEETDDVSFTAMITS